MAVMFDAMKDAIWNTSNLGYVFALAATIGFGQVYYGPRLMGDVWANAQGIEKKQQKRKMDRGIMSAMVAMYFVMVLVVSYLADQTGCKTVNDALWLGALLWLGFALPLAVVQHSYNPSGKKVVLLLDLTYQLMYFLAQAVCIVYFKNWPWDSFFGAGNGDAEAVAEDAEAAKAE